VACTVVVATIPQQEDSAMFDQIFDSMRKAAESSLQFQQQMFKNWASLWPGWPSSQPATEQVAKFQKQWAEITADLIRKQSEAIEAELRAGLHNLEAAFRQTDSKDVAELQRKTIELWQKTLASLQKCFEAQAHNFQMAMIRWTELAMKGAAYSWATS
jgi:hypothetical protein